MCVKKETQNIPLMLKEEEELKKNPSLLIPIEFSEKNERVGKLIIEVC
jgi:hypothetical protein